MGAIHLSEVRCSGQEPSLWKCPSKNITAEDCSHSQDAGVRCNLPYTGVETKVSHTFYFGVCLGLASNTWPDCAQPFIPGPAVPQLPQDPAICRPLLCLCSLLQAVAPKASPCTPSILYPCRSDSAGAEAVMRGELRCK